MGAWAGVQSTAGRPRKQRLRRGRCKRIAALLPSNTCALQPLTALPLARLPLAQYQNGLLNPLPPPAGAQVSLLAGLRRLTRLSLACVSDVRGRLSLPAELRALAGTLAYLVRGVGSL